MQLEHLEFFIHVLLKPSLENFKHYFPSMWDECNCAVVWAFFGTAFLWDWNENWSFPCLWPLLSFPHLLAYWAQHFHSIIFWIWNSSMGIPSPPLALFIVMLPKAHLTLHSSMAGSRSHHCDYLDFSLVGLKNTHPWSALFILNCGLYVIITSYWSITTVVSFSDKFSR